MKLLKRTGLYFIGFSFLTLLISSIGIFYGLRYMLDQEMDESLQHTRSILKKELSSRPSLPEKLEIMDEIIDISEVPVYSSMESFGDTIRSVQDEDEYEIEPFRQYKYTELINGKYYKISLHHSKFGSEHLMSLILALVVGFLFLFFLLLNLFNRYLSQKLWRPFYHMIDQISHYSFTNSDRLTTVRTNTEEFNTLNNALIQLTEKLRKDYQSLKHFAENASHEIQTPLAIIRSQLDLLLQKKQDDEAIRYVHQIQESTSKLSKLNKSLLLLTRIENRQFEDVCDVQFDKVVDQKLRAFEVMIEAKELTVQKHLQKTILRVNSILADVVVSNLISNAIRHNVPKGRIDVVLTEEKLVVGNTGVASAKETKELFERFRKSDDSGKSIGLGLAIVKEICDLYGWKIQYQNEGDWHELQIDFDLK